MHTALVTGGAGFIGSHLCERLLDEGNAVICVDNFLTGIKSNIEAYLDHPKFTLLQQDVTKPLPSYLKAHFIFHLASPASPNHHSPISYHALPFETMMVNTTGTHELLKFSEAHKAKFLFASTSEIYGDPLQHPQSEDYRGNVSTTGQRSVYDEAKRFGETLCAYYWRDKQVDTRIVRLFNTYGPKMNKADRRMIVNFIFQAFEGKPITIYGEGKQTRSLCYIDDTVEGIYKAMFTAQTTGQVINIGSVNEFTILEYARLVKKLTNSDSEIIFSEGLPEDDPVKRQPDITKAKKLLQWEPQVEIEDGLKKMIDYYRII